MRSSIVAFFVGCLCLGVHAATVALHASGRNHLVGIHNEARMNEPATNMTILKWDTDLAKHAQTWTDKCVFAHQSGSSWGENLSAKTYHSTNLTVSLDAMFKLWMNEKSRNSGGTFEECCSRHTHTCCHYTQVIWAKTSLLGCGLTLCKSLKLTSRTMSNALFMACYYDPPGNHPDWKPYVRR